MPTEPDLEPPYGVIWQSLADGDVVPFLGAGASLIGRGAATAWDPRDSAFLPLGSELAEYLATQISFPSSQAADREDLAKVCSYYTYVSSRQGLRKRLKDALRASPGPGSLHRLLAAVPANLILVTTNYDTLLEEAFQGAGRRYDLVVYPSDLEEFPSAICVRRWHSQEFEIEDPLHLSFDLREASVIFKMHGTTNLSLRRDIFSRKPPEDSFVITEEDYVDFLTKMVQQTAVPPWFMKEFRLRPFLFLGYGLRDWNLRVVLNTFQNPYRFSSEAGESTDADNATDVDDQRSWAIQKMPTALEMRLWERRNVLIFDQSVEEFAEALWRASGLRPPNVARDG